jgi:predicted aminopeptidase
MALMISLQSCYLVKQGVGQFKLRFEQVPLEQAIADEQNEDYRQLLKSVPSIKQFAVNRLGLKDNENHTGYYFTAAEGVVFVVTASPKTKLEPYTWWFPLVGTVPYKGFFDRTDAVKYEERFKLKGFDTWLFAAPAYSTLGWFKDPLTTPMLKKGKYSLVSTLIHEMVHSTLYIKGQGDFNEQLAAFVEDKGTEAYFQFYNLLDESKRMSIRENKEKRKEFAALVENSIFRLNKLYDSGAEEPVMLAQRDALFSQLTGEVEKLYPERPTGYWAFNNARLLQYRRYREDSALFDGFWHQSGQDWQQFWSILKAYVTNQGWHS